MLDPTDPLFLRVGRLFLQILRRQFSPFVHHIFSADTFNEMQPTSGDLDYLANVSRGVFDAMTGNYVVNIRHFQQNAANIWSSQQLGKCVERRICCHDRSLCSQYQTLSMKGDHNWKVSTIWLMYIERSIRCYDR